MLRDRDYMVMEGSKFLLLSGFYFFHFYSLFFLFIILVFRFDNSRQQEDAHQSAPFAATVRNDEELNKVGNFRVFYFKLSIF